MLLYAYVTWLPKKLYKHRDVMNAICFCLKVLKRLSLVLS